MCTAHLCALHVADNKEWNSFSTGGITIVMFFLSTFITAAFYVGVVGLVLNAGKKSDSKKIMAALVVVVKRGGMLVGVFFSTWILFLVAAIINYSGNTISVTFEMIASLGISVQVLRAHPPRFALKTRELIWVS